MDVHYFDFIHALMKVAVYMVTKMVYVLSELEVCSAKICSDHYL